MNFGLLDNVNVDTALARRSQASAKRRASDSSGGFSRSSTSMEKAPPAPTAAVLDVSFATRRSPGLASALGRGWLTL